MAGDGVNWQGLLKWSLSHADGTGSARNLRYPQRLLFPETAHRLKGYSGSFLGFSDEDRRWFMDSMREHSVDVIQRMKEITEVMKIPPDVLESQGVSTADIEGMLDELQEHVESIDMANDLHSIGGLSPLLGYLKNSNPSIRAKAEDVVMTIVQNNPKGQQLVMNTTGLDPLLSNFSSDPDVTVRSKALGAISSLIRNNKAGVTAFKLANGYAALKDALISDDPRFQRKALNLIHYLLQDCKSDCSTISDLGFPKLMLHLASSDDFGLREAALAGLVELARDQSAGGGSSLDKEKLQQVLQDRINGINSMDADDLGAAREERQLVDSLWNACYSEPSSLREKGLLVLPGEENPGQPPDVAGKLFEPPLRAWAAHNSLRTQTQNRSAEEDEKPPLLLGPGSSPSGTNL